MVEAGRVAFVNFGEDYGKVVVIVDMLNSNSVLVDNPLTGFPRVLYPIRRLTLTSLKMNLLRGARTGTVKKVATEFKLNEKWEETAFAKKFAKRATRANLTDFDRFKVMVSKKNRAYKVNKLAKKMLSKN